MLNNDDKIRVENRDNTLVGYIVPDSKVIRRFNAYETKEIPMGELRAMSQDKGCRNIIKNHLIIHSQEAAAEIMPDAEPEYFYNTKDVDFLLEAGSLDQLLDALDFAPEGVVNLIKDQAVNLELNDMRKREAILEKTGFDVSKSIEIKRMTATAKTEEVKTRRVAVNTSVEEEVNTPARRSETPKFKVSIKTN